MNAVDEIKEQVGETRNASMVNAAQETVTGNFVDTAVKAQDRIVNDIEFETQRDLLPIRDEINQLEGKQMVEAQSSKCGSRMENIVTALIFSMIFSFVLFWVLLFV